MREDFDLELSSPLIYIDLKNPDIEIGLEGGTRGLQGEQGIQGPVGPQGDQGIQGQAGTDGQDGVDGQDGFSPIITTSKVGKETTITITDAQGTQTATILDGQDGTGVGDMLKSVYDTNDNGIVDNAEKVNNHTVEEDVPSGAVFTDTTYTAGTGIDITNGVISNTQTSAEWGNITGTINNQSDLMSLIASIPGFKVEVVSVLPVSDIDTHTIYLILKTPSGSGDDIYDEYLYINNSWELIGSTAVDISGKQDKIDSSHKLSADLIDDTSTTNKLTNATEKSTWNGKQDALVSGTNIKTINGNSILGSGDLALNIYSSTETVVGIWQDGKTIYRKYVSGTTRNDGQSLTIISNVSDLVSHEIVVNRSGESQKHPLSSAMSGYDSSHAYPLFLDGTTLKLFIINNNYKGQSFYGWVEYTKTSS